MKCKEVLHDENSSETNVARDHVLVSFVDFVQWELLDLALYTREFGKVDLGTHRELVEKRGGGELGGTYAVF